MKSKKCPFTIGWPLHPISDNFCKFRNPTPPPRKFLGIEIYTHPPPLKIKTSTGTSQMCLSFDIHILDLRVWVTPSHRKVFFDCIVPSSMKDIKQKQIIQMEIQVFLEGQNYVT